MNKLTTQVDEIVEIEELEEEIDTIDIELSGNRLFFANNILTHNSGIDVTDIGMSAVSESLGGPMTMDLLIALIATEDLTKQNQVMIQQLKNRYSDVYQNKTLFIGVDRPKMKFYELVQGNLQSMSKKVQSFQKP